jgi:hypothetical protein
MFASSSVSRVAFGASTSVANGRGVTRKGADLRFAAESTA